MSQMQPPPPPLATKPDSGRRVLIAGAQAGVILLSLVVLFAGACFGILFQFNSNRTEANAATAITAAITLLVLFGLVRLFIFLNRRRKNAVATPTAVRLDVDHDGSMQSTLQVLRIALMAILLVGIGGIAMRFAAGRPPVGIIVISLVMFGVYVAPYVFALLRIYERFDETGVCLAHAYAWASIVMSLRWITFIGSSAPGLRQWLIVSAINLLLDIAVIYAGVRLWRAVRAELFIAFIVGALVYRALVDFVAPMLYIRFGA